MRGEHGTVRRRLSITERAARQQSPAASVGVLFLAQALVTAVAVFMVFLQGMQAAGCADLCDYETAYIANLALWIAAPIISAVTLACLLIWRSRGWRNWTAAVGGIIAIFTAALIAKAVLSAAL